MEGCTLSSQKSDFNIFSVNLITDATAIPFGWLLSARDDAWAEDARDLLTELAADLPEHAHNIVLGDRIHTGEPFLERLDELHWDYIFRAPSDTLIETRRGWKMLKQLTLKPNNGRFVPHVRVWKGHKRRTNVSGYKLARNGFRAVTWFVVSSLPPAQERFVAYACRWWHEIYQPHYPHTRHVPPVVQPAWLLLMLCIRWSDSLSQTMRHQTSAITPAFARLIDTRLAGGARA